MPLLPKRVKYPRRSGGVLGSHAKHLHCVWEYALQTLDRAWITNTQIKRLVLHARNMKRKGKL
jgi:hypothetical protein